MTRPIPYVFCRYEFSINDEPLDAVEQLKILEDLRGKMVAHRKANPTPADEDTFIMKIRQRRVERQTVLRWHVAQQLSMREKARYDRENDEIMEEAEDTDEIRHTKLIALPSLGLLAADDRITDRSLGAKAAISRLKSVFASIRGGRARVEFAGTPQDLQHALDTWDLRNFTFSLRPFNPTIRKPGDKLHEMIEADGIGVLRGVALPVGEKEMRDSHEGLISEAKGLADSGYGQIAVAGITPGRRQATFGKPKFDGNKEKNLQRQALPRILKVYIDPQDTIEAEEAEVVRALLEFYGSKG